jgi:hypothetical protein
MVAFFPLFLALAAVGIALCTRNQTAMEVIGMLLVLCLILLGLLIWVLIGVGEAWSGDEGGGAVLQLYTLAAAVGVAGYYAVAVLRLRRSRRGPRAEKRQCGPRH